MLDDTLEPVLEGQEGELVLGSPGEPVRTGERARWRAGGLTLCAPRIPAADRVAPRAPRTATEALVVELVSGLVGSPAEPDSDFFALGGHSILAIHLASRLGDWLGVSVPVRWVYDWPVLADLARHLETTAAPAEPVVRVADGPFALTPA